MSRRVLVVAAHPDDEVLGCGGTMARHVMEGDRVEVLILGEGITSRTPSRVPGHEHSDLEALRSDAAEANRVLGVHDLHFRAFPDNRFDSVDLLELVKAIEEIASAIAPTTVYTHHEGDVNVDHGCAFRAALAAFRPKPGSQVREMFTFEVPSSTEWAHSSGGRVHTPRHFVDIGRTLEVKIDAMSRYRTELCAWPHPRSLEAIEHLARWRGATVGFEAAEAFDVVRSMR